MAAGRGTPLLFKRRTIGTIAHSQMGKITAEASGDKNCRPCALGQYSLDELRRHECLDDSAYQGSNHHERAPLPI